jgi:hypothetical protein
MQTVVSGENYSVEWDPELRTVALVGILRLNGLEEYAPVSRFLSEAVPAGAMTLDLRKLEFLNSSGIAMLSKFIIEMRNRKTVELTMIGAKSVAWQGKSLPNLCKLMPSLDMQFV